MKPNFALNLSHDGLSLLHRAKDGWRLVGSVGLDDPDMAQKLGYFRRTASELARGQLAAKLVIPNSQILYREFDIQEFNSKPNQETVRNALDGLTPYPVDELLFDWAEIEPGKVQVAAVAHETLEEAESFAHEHRFNPVSFVAIPDTGSFPKEPFFGQSRLSKTLLDAGDRVEPETEIITIVGPSEDPDRDTEIPPDAALTGAEPAIPPAPLPLTHRETTPDDDQVTGAFATRRSDTGPALIEPNPARPGARFALYPDKQAKDDAPKRGKKLEGSDRKPPEIARVAVTAPTLAGDGPKSRKKPKPKRQKKNAPVGIPPAPAEMSSAAASAQPDIRAEITPAPQPTPRQKALDGEELTIFGARRRAAPPAQTNRMGLALTLGFITVLGLAALLVIFFRMGPDPDPVAAPGPDAIASEQVTPPDPTPQPTDTIATTPPEQSVDQTPLVEPTPVEQQDNPPADAPAPTETDTATRQDPQDQADLINRILSEAEVAESDDLDQINGQLSPEAAEQVHAETGIWPLSPIPPVDLDSDRVDDIYIASIDRKIISNDAIALPGGVATLRDNPLSEILSPPVAGTRFDLDDNGLVRPRPEGAVNPDGVLIFRGSPSTLPLLRPGTAQPETEAAVEPIRPPNTRPLARPTGLVEIDEKARLGGRTRSELAAIRPLARPASPQDNNSDVDLTPTALAVLRSPGPVTRPNGFSSIVEKAVAEALASATDADTTIAANSVAAPSSPTIPTRASVARAATAKNAINLSHINLIGVYGSSSDRRALVRLKSGRYVKVQIGDRLDGGKVAAIGTRKLQYIKRGQTLTLEIAS